MDEVRQPHQQLSITGLPDTQPGIRKCTPGLLKLISDDGKNDGFGAIRLIAINPTLRAEAQRLCPVLTEAAGAKPHPDPDEHEVQVLKLLIKHARPLGVAPLSGGAWGDLWDIYLDTLMDTPLEWIEGAFDRWHHGMAYPDRPEQHKFYPKPVELLTQAKAYQREVIMAAYRCGKALDWKEAPKPMSPEDRARERQAAIDEGLITPEGRAIISLAMKPAEPRAAQGPTPQQMAQQLRERADDVGDVV